MSRMGKRLALGSLAVALALAGGQSAWASYSTDYPYLCSAQSAQSWPLIQAGCCSTNTTACADPSPLPQNYTRPTPTDRPNILLVVSDDQDYCRYGFMNGICEQPRSRALEGGGTAGEWVDCSSEARCRDLSLGRCVASADAATCPAGWSCPEVPLRLNELTCRNRQPKKKGRCDGDTDNDATFPQRTMAYDRAKSPCSDTQAGALMPARTPFLDRLAKKGTVFPRAYVAGTYCKNSRNSMLHGRYPRHMQYRFVNAGRGDNECRWEKTVANPKGCPKKADPGAGCGSQRCETQHTIAHWLDSNRASFDPLAGETPTTVFNLPLDQAGYRRFAFGKTEIVSPGEGGFAEQGDGGSFVDRSAGFFRCKACDGAGSSCTVTQCQEAASAGLNGNPAHLVTPLFERKRDGLEPLAKAIHTTITAVTDTGPYIQTNPFFIWFGPKLPHEGAVTSDYEGLFNGFGAAERPGIDHRGYYERVAMLDTLIGGLEYHLSRSCVCKTSTAQESLWDNTVVLFLADQGWFLPRSKHNSREVTQRTPLIISTPDQRHATGPGKVYDGELASAIDILPTVLAYAGGRAQGSSEARYVKDIPNATIYEHGRNLRPLVEHTTSGLPTGWKPRKLFFGEQAEVDGNSGLEQGLPKHVVTRPGLLGVCDAPYDFGAGRKHVHPCLSDGDCAVVGAGVRCVCPPSDLSPKCSTQGPANPERWKRCVNRPEQRCDNDAQCAEGPSGNLCVDKPNDAPNKWCAQPATPCTGPGQCRDEYATCNVATGWCTGSRARTRTSSGRGALPTASASPKACAGP